MCAAMDYSRRGGYHCNDEMSNDNTNSIIDMAIVGKVLSDRPYNFEAFKKTMNQIWLISKQAIFRSIENGLFVVQFACAREQRRC